MQEGNWLVAFDDVLVERWRHCTVCGRALTTGIRFSIWQTRGMAIATLLCAACKRSDPQGLSIASVMQRRYGGEAHDEEYA